MNMTNIYEDKVLNTFRKITATAPAKIYAGLLTELPTGNNLGEEATYIGYQRKETIFSAPAENISAYGTGKIGMSNTNKLLWEKLNDPAGTALGVGFWDSQTGGNMWAYSPISDGLVLDANEQPFIDVNNARLIADGKFTKTFKIDILNLLRGQSISGFDTFIGLANGDPTEGGTELAGDNYSRKSVVFSAPAQQENEQAISLNTNEILFNTPTTVWGLWTHNIYTVGIAGTNIVAVSAVTDASGLPIGKQIKVGRTPFANVGDLKNGVN